MELLLVCPVAPLFMAPLLHPGFFQLSLAQAARALLISSLPFLCILIVVGGVYHFLMPGWLRRVRHPLGRTALHAVGIIGIDADGQYHDLDRGLQVHGLMRLSVVLELHHLRIFFHRSRDSWFKGCASVIPRRNSARPDRAPATACGKLQALQARTNPHFLFNGLNTIASLIADDPQRAEQTVVHLAELLRYALNSGGLSRVPLSREVQIARRLPGRATGPLRGPSAL